MDRRSFVKSFGIIAAGATTTLPTLKAKASSGPTIIVVGGGFGGASVAKYLKLWGQSDVNVILIDSQPAHVSCILSNLVLNDQKKLANITFDLAKTAEKNRFTFKSGRVDSINKFDKLIRVVNNQVEEWLAYDRLVLAPGIDFIYPEGMNPALPDATTPFPHAWQAGLQTVNLQQQLQKLPAGGRAKVVMTIPKSPYRCPPGPYERACLIADYLKTRKNGGKLIIFDENKEIQAEPINFGKAFKGIYSGIIQYVPNSAVSRVTASSQFDTNKTITVKNGANEITQTGCHLINVIPNQRAPELLFKAGLVDELSSKKWAGVHIDTYQSLFDPSIYIIGDAHDSNQPKAGHIANSEAKICADALLRELLGWNARDVDDVPVTNSACYSPITSSTASFLTAGFRYDPATDKMLKIDAAFGEAEEITSDNYKMMLAWANNLFAEVF